ncbi:MAG: carboxyl transferase domain-containing protein [Sneathiella sp.]
MPVIQSEIDTQSDAFQSNRASMLEKIQEFRDLEQRVRDTSNAKKDKFEKRGQLLPRERIALLLDKGAPFLQISTLAGLGMHDDDGKKDVLGGGMIAGIGYVCGVRCMIKASDSAIKGGTIAPMGLEKNLRCQEIVLKNKLPVINLVESGGANLLYQSEIFIKGGQGFANQARMSAAGIPQITVVHGSSTAGGAYQPGLSDYVIMVRGGAKVFLAGPPLLKAATGEIATDEELGGAEMHSAVSGVSEYLAENDADGIRLAREVMSNIPWQRASKEVVGTGYDEPLYDIEDLLGVVPTDYRKPYDVHEVIARIVDGSDFLDFKQLYGIHTVCGHARIEGQPVGIIGNNGPIDADGATKAAQFIQLCCQSGTPIIFLQNTTGFMVGSEAEQSGIIKHGSKMIQAVTNATVPKITLHIGASFGAGNYGMCGRSFDPRFIFAWPNNRVAVMGGEQAAKVMSIVTEEKFKRMGQEPDYEALEKMEQGIIKRMDKESESLFATARLWDDGIIDPRDTRKILSYCLSVAQDGDERQPNKNTFGIGRM